MTDLMTTLPVILAQFSCPGEQQASGALFHSHVQGWFCFLIISFLTVSSWAISDVEINDLQECLRNLNKTIKKSDAMLYTPSFDYTNVSCRTVILNCYMLELTMVLDEEEVPLDDYSKSIYSFSKQFEKQTNIQTAIGCLRCEAYSLQNITIFLDRLKDFLQRMASDPKGNV